MMTCLPDDRLVESVGQKLVVEVHVSNNDMGKPLEIKFRLLGIDT